jgi:WD40 repeat protein
VVGDQVVHTRFHQVMLRDVGTGALLKQCSVGDYPGVLAADSARGMVHLCGSGSLIRTWRLTEAGFEAREELCGDKVDCLASSEDGALLALGTAEGAVMLYALNDPGRIVRGFAPAHNRYGCNALHIDVAGDKLWAACGGRIVRWRLSTGEQEACSEHQKNELYAMLILPERGELVAAARGTRRTYGELVVLELETLNALHTERLTETVVGITRRGADEVLLRGGYGTRGFDVVRRVFTTYDINRARGASVADAAPVAVRAMSRFNNERDDYDYWLELVTLEEDPKPVGERVVCTAAVAGQPLWLDVERGMIIALLYDRTVRIWNMNTGEQIECLHVQIGSPNELLQVPGQARFVACGVDGSVEMIDLH